jgi:acetylornithine deacetylase/succinyl-diaminopimelate desuccinylase-like protein
MVAGVLKVDVMKEGTHSGLASGIVPSTFRIARNILNRVEDVETGEIKLAELQAPIPEGRVAEAKTAAAVLGDDIFGNFPFLDGVEPLCRDPVELLLNRTWRAGMEVTGADGIPPTSIAGNVLRPTTSFTLSMRLPPTVDGATAAKALETALNATAPYNAKVSFVAKKNCTGWNAPVSPKWLTDAAEAASQSYFQKSAMYFGEGGSIPFMGQLGVAYPKASFVVTGVLGKGSNAHSTDEKLSVTMAKKLTGCVASIINAHALKGKRPRE